MRHTLLKVLRGSVDELEGGQLEPALLEAADDAADESALDTVGLYACRTRSVHLFDSLSPPRRVVRTLTMM